MTALTARYSRFPSLLAGFSPSLRPHWLLFAVFLLLCGWLAAALTALHGLSFPSWLYCSSQPFFSFVLFFSFIDGLSSSLRPCCSSRPFFSFVTDCTALHDLCFPL
ncbi:hypothetical protein QOT17_010421 [Balamuthia mandrillaris]